MNFVQWHLGDWIASTSLLSATERGVYFDLLVRYYKEERPIMQIECKRIARAYAPEEREAMKYVLNEFFELEDDSYRHHRCDEEIAAFKAKSEKRSIAAKARWSKEVAPKTGGDGDASADSSEEQDQCKRNANAEHLECLTNNHKPIEEAKASSKKTRARRAPPSWPVEDNIDEETRKAYLELRRAKRAGPFTAKAYELMRSEAESDGVDMRAALEKCIKRGWVGYYPDNNAMKTSNAKNSRPFDKGTIFEDDTYDFNILLQDSHS